MKCYLLLRDNVESGPYDLADLTTRKLLGTDLIWVEGSSHSWRFPAEIAELAHLVQQSPLQTNQKEKEQPAEAPESTSVFVALPPQPVQQNPVIKETIAEDNELETLYEQPLETLKVQYENHLKQRQHYFSNKNKAQRVLWLAALFAGLLAGAFMIKKMADAAGTNDSQNGLAAMPVTAYPGTEQQAASADYQNALSTELVAVDTLAAKPKAAKKKVSLKKQVTLSATEFKKGVFGGINDLELTVNNKSEHVLDKVTIEVQYLKPNGKIIKKEDYTLKAIAPKSTKNLVIPPSKRGVDIKYRITNIQSHEATAAMREL